VKEQIKIPVSSMGIENLDHLSEQSIMLFLKEAGAPIEGKVYLTLKEGWSVRRSVDPTLGSTFIFTKKDQP
jgi:ribosomal protein S10